MAYKNRFHKSLLGVDAETIVTKGVAYTDDTDLKDFQANAVEGELAVFNADTLAVLTAGAAVGVKVFIAIKRDGNVQRTATFAIQAGMLTKLAYVAPVKQISTITTAGVAATLVDGGTDITYVAKQGGTGGNSLQVEYIDSASNNVPLTVTATATKVTVNLATDGSSAPTSTATQIAAAVNASAAASLLMRAVVTGTGTDVAAAMAATNLAGGVAGGPTLVKGNQLELVVVETTPGLEPMPRYNYMVTATQGETFDEAILRLIAVINDSANLENRDKTLIVTAAQSSLTNDFTLTAIDFGTHFTVALRGILEDYASHAITTPFVQGSGTPDEVKEAELAGDVRRSVGVYYPIQNAQPSEFGVPTSFADANGSAATYVIYTIKHVSEDTTRTLGKEFRKNYIFLYVFDTTADPISELDTIFANAD